MNYTTNYHLPQWVETDRIRMEDFNQAMADIDEGIAEERSARQEAINDLSQSAAQSQAAAKTELFNKLRQSGYDLYQMAGRAACKNLFSFAAKSMVINTLHTAEELARAEICLHLTGGGIQIGPATELTLAKINAAIYEWTNGEAASIAASATAAVKFRSTFRGTITKLNVWYHRTNVNNTGSLPLYVRLYDQATGSRIYQSERLSGKVMSQTDTADTLTVAVPVEPNRDYRLELYSGGDIFTGTIGFGTMGTEALTGEAAGQAITSCSVTDSMTLETRADQAVAVVHYSGGDQAPTATLDGQAMTAGTPKAATALDGTACQELEFFLEGSFSGAVTLVVSAQSSGSDLTLHDAGAYFN